MLHMADQRIAPVGNIDGSVTADFDVRWSKCGIRGVEDGLNFFSRNIGSVETDFMLQHALKSNHVAYQEVSIVGLREMATR